jgi:hypothetical protein
MQPLKVSNSLGLSGRVGGLPRAWADCEHRGKHGLVSTVQPVQEEIEINRNSRIAAHRGHVTAAPMVFTPVNREGRGPRVLPGLNRFKALSLQRYYPVQRSNSRSMAPGLYLAYQARTEGADPRTRERAQISEVGQATVALPLSAQAGDTPWLPSPPVIVWPASEICAPGYNSGCAIIGETQIAKHSAANARCALRSHRPLKARTPQNGVGRLAFAPADRRRPPLRRETRVVRHPRPPRNEASMTRRGTREHTPFEHSRTPKIFFSPHARPAAQRKEKPWT